MSDVDMDSGEIIAAGNPYKGRKLKGTVLIYKETKGSSGGCVVLMTLATKRMAPTAIVTMKPADYNMPEGAIMAKGPPCAVLTETCSPRSRRGGACVSMRTPASSRSSIRTRG